MREDENLCGQVHTKVADLTSFIVNISLDER